MNDVPSGERLHIGLFGRRNAGKSSLLNVLTGQAAAVVSETPGTTTDPVSKAMELLPIGPVVFIDTPGFDDAGGLGELRVARTRQVLVKTDIALLVMDACVGKTEDDEELAHLLSQRGIPFLAVYTKDDLCGAAEDAPELRVSAETGQNIEILKEQIARLASQRQEPPPLVGDLVRPGDLVVLVTPIDDAAPKGRLILPQQQTIRDILDHGATAIAVRDLELSETLRTLGRTPDLVITDSQVFDAVAKIVPREVPLTSFSILFARYKGNLELAAHGAQTLKTLKDGDHVLICEGCTHHRQCEDIGTVKLPRMLKQFTQKDLQFTFTSGTDFPSDLSPYQVIIHCGGCTLTEKEMQYRLDCAREQGIPITNYGIAIAYMRGILERSMELF